MIAEGVITAGVAFVKFILGLFPTADAPSWLASGTGALAVVWSYAAGLGAWIPWPFVGTVVAAVLLCMVIGLAIKLTRIVASFMTLGGGGAG